MVKRSRPGKTVSDPELVARLVARRRQRDPLDRLTERERAVLALMAQGLTDQRRSRPGPALGGETVEAHLTSLFNKLDLTQDNREHRRGLAVLTFLRA